MVAQFSCPCPRLQIERRTVARAHTSSSKINPGLVTAYLVAHAKIPPVKILLEADEDELQVIGAVALPKETERDNHNAAVSARQAESRVADVSPFWILPVFAALIDDPEAGSIPSLP